MDGFGLIAVFIDCEYQTAVHQFFIDIDGHSSEPGVAEALAALEQSAGRMSEQMDKLTGTIAALQEKMADPGFYARDPAAFDKVAGDLQAMQDKLAAAEEQWLELEMLREELEG